MGRFRTFSMEEIFIKAGSWRKLSPSRTLAPTADTFCALRLVSQNYKIDHWFPYFSRVLKLTHFTTDQWRKMAQIWIWASVMLPQDCVVDKSTNFCTWIAGQKKYRNRYNWSMHCTGIRRPSLGVDRDRRSRRQFDSDRKFEQDSQPKTKGNETLNQSRYKAKRQLKDSRNTSNRRNSSAPLQFHQDQQKRQHRNLLDRTLQFDERSFPHLTSNNKRERLQKHISRNRHSNLLQTNDIFEKEQRQQEARLQRQEKAQQ